MPTRVGAASNDGEAPGPASWPALDDRFKRLRLLGTGGVGEVYLAVDRAQGREVALKVLTRVHSAAVPSLLDEARATARIHHENVVAVLDFGSADDRFFIAFEFIDGRDLRAQMRQGLSRADAIRSLRDVAAGLAAAHAADVLHLDVKPENVLVGNDGKARLVDFGLARVRSGDACIDVVGSPSGTPAYMAPELWTGAGVCDGTDVWSFAVLACELLEGRRPYEAATASEAIASVLASGGVRAPAFADLDPTLADLLRAGLGADRHARPYMRDLARALELAVA